jgi:hypothetical protein
VTGARYAVLELLLDHHPRLLSTEEVIRELTAAPEEFADRDRISIAIRELVEAGLANRVGAFVFASHAAASFRQFEKA